MREVLFRGKRVDNGEWTYGNLVQEKGCHFIWSIDSNQIFGVREDVVIPETVEQYTGLTDKNGTKIFEGDIVKFCSKLYEVVYNENTASFTGINKYFGWAVSLTKIMEVVSNVHDNPELLEGETK